MFLSRRVLVDMGLWVYLCRSFFGMKGIARQSMTSRCRQKFETRKKATCKGRYTKLNAKDIPGTPNEVPSTPNEVPGTLICKVLGLNTQQIKPASAIYSAECIKMCRAQNDLQNRVGG